MAGRAFLLFGQNIDHCYEICVSFEILESGEVLHKLDKQDVASAENLMKIRRDTIKGH